MSTLTAIEKMKFETILKSPNGPGYILDFSDRTFDDFILSNSKKDISEEKYRRNGTSKANRLRAFWSIEPDDVVGRLLSELLEYWKAQKLIKKEVIDYHEQALYDECQGIAGRLSGRATINHAITENEFIQKEFKDTSLEKLHLSAGIAGVLEQRLVEIRKCLGAKASLAVIFLCGSTLEGILLGVASVNPKDFNSAKASPKDRAGKVLSLQDWKLMSFIDVACELQLLEEDVRKFSHALRDFRNYIHPYEQMTSGFNPDHHTAEICWKVLQAAIAQLSKSLANSGSASHFTSF